jgi:large subunit ribosomal protein L4
MSDYKTKEFVKMMDSLKVSGKTLFVMAEKDDHVVRSAGNIPAVKTTLTSQINVYDLMNAQTVVLTKDAVAKLEEVYA